MGADAGTLPAATPARRKAWSLAIPWVTTRLTTDLALYFLAQPLFWVLGIEFFAPVLLAPWFLLKYVLGTFKIRLPAPGWPLLLFFLLRLLHVVSVAPGEMDLFIKDQSTFFTLICLFLLVYNMADTPARWHKALLAIEWFGSLSLIVGVVFVSGLWSGQFQSLIGRLLPAALVENSHFFSSITGRTLGVLEPATGYRRVQATLWHPNSLAALMLVLFAVQWVQLRRPGAGAKGWRALAMLLTLANLFFTYSRTSYVALLLILFVGWWLDNRSGRSRLQKSLALIAGTMLVSFYLYVALASEELPGLELLNDFIYRIRPYSIGTRLAIYQASGKLLQQKPWWGWSTQVRIPGLPSYFSAGSHSDYLSMAFRYGLPAFLLYLLFLGGIWLALLRGYWQARQREHRTFFAVSIGLMLAINLRQLTSGLWWDTYLGSAIWVFWALALARSRQAARQAWPLSPPATGGNGQTGPDTLEFAADTM